MSSREIAKNLTPALRAAMENASGTHTGAFVPAVKFSHAATGTERRDLEALGLIGPNGGLTDVGANVALIVKREQEERLFG